MGTTDVPPKSSTRLAVAIGVVMNCLTAGSVQLFPLVSVPLARTLHLSSAQTAIIATSTIMGQYGSATAWGALADIRGPGLVSSCSGVIYGVGYGLLGWRYIILMAREKQGIPLGEYEWLLFAAIYSLTGVATTASYFSAIIASTKSLPQRHSGLAIGVPSSIFGLSPLFLSNFASFFTSGVTHELEPGRWLLFLAGFLGIINIIGGLTLKVIPWVEEERLVIEDATTTERTALLPTPLTSTPEQSQPLTVLFRNPTFLIFWLVMMLSTGPCEMVVASVGGLVEAILGPQAPSTDLVMLVTAGGGHALKLRRLHVQIISVANTFSRLVAGALSDWLSYTSSPHPALPQPPRPSSSSLLARLIFPFQSYFHRPPRVSRLAFVLASTILLAVTFLYSSLFLTNPSHLYILTTSIGIAYGTLFTLCPAIVRTVYPVQDFGRNFGFMSWASASGALVFTPLYGSLVDRAAERQGRGDVCYGRDCWKEIFGLSTASTVLAAVLVIVLWRGWWRGKV